MYNFLLIVFYITVTTIHLINCTKGIRANAISISVFCGLRVNANGEEVYDYVILIAVPVTLTSKESVYSDKLGPYSPCPSP